MTKQKSGKMVKSFERDYVAEKIKKQRYTPHVGEYKRLQDRLKNFGFEVSTARAVYPNNKSFEEMTLSEAVLGLATELRSYRRLMNGFYEDLDEKSFFIYLKHLNQGIKDRDMTFFRLMRRAAEESQ